MDRPAVITLWFVVYGRFGSVPWKASCRTWGHGMLISWVSCWPVWTNQMLNRASGDNEQIVVKPWTQSLDIISEGNDLCPETVVMP